MEDALKRLDKLTHEEARMATVQVLRATNVVDERVTGVAESVLGVADRVVSADNRVKDVDDRVAGVSDQVAGVDKTVSGVDDKVASMNDGLKEVGEKVGDIVNGAQAILTQTSMPYLTLACLDGKEVKVAVQQTANDVDKLKRLSSPSLRQIQLYSLMHPRREPTMGEHPQMAFSTRPVYEP